MELNSENTEKLSEVIMTINDWKQRFCKQNDENINLQCKKGRP